MKIFILIAPLALSLLLPFQQAIAGTYDNGKVGRMIVARLDSEVLFQMLDGAQNNFPCPNTHPSGFMYSLSTTSHPNTFDAVLSTLITARVAGLTVTVVGSGACTPSNNTEIVEYLRIEN